MHWEMKKLKGPQGHQSRGRNSCVEKTRLTTVMGFKENRGCGLVVGKTESNSVGGEGILDECGP